ncbi:MAG: retropepsin-like domain-containing protein [candidate division Zixibacteria bacterium]|nr:retropepsin-like domain-containing protein [candidate division Zixibacteria bacterium]
MDKNQTILVPQDSADPILGKTSLEYYNGYLFATGRVDGSRRGSFIIDFGAGSTLIDGTLLDDSVRLSPVSAAGDRNITGNVIDGFGGSIAGFAGYTNLRWIRIGNYRWENATVRVVDSLPEIGGKEILGILGMDLLAQIPVILFSYGINEETAVMYFMADDNADRTRDIAEIPFGIVGSHMFITGRVNDKPVYFILDTGSANNILMTEVARTANIGIDTTVAAQFSGLDGMTITAQIGLADSIALESFIVHGVPFYVAELPSLSPPGAKRNIGVLGNSLLERYDRITIDFTRGVIRLIGK